MKKIIISILMPILVFTCFFTISTINVNAYYENSNEYIGAYYDENDAMFLKEKVFKKCK